MIQREFRVVNKHVKLYLPFYYFYLLDLPMFVITLQIIILLSIFVLFSSTNI